MGFVAVLYVYTRPSALILFIFLLVFVVYRAVRARSFLPIITFLAGSAVVFSVGILNVYINDKRLGLFTGSASEIYNMQIRSGPVWMKYETSVDSNYPLPNMYYVNSKNVIFRSIPCNDAAHCAVTYLTREPLRYFNSFALHLFNMFDRTYLDIYVGRIMNRTTWLALVNYVVIASVMVYWLFFPVRPHFRSLLLAIGVIIFGSVVVYLPTVVESRFSAPLYPLLLVIFAIFMREVSHNRSRVILVKTAVSIIVLVIGMYTISDLVDLQLWNGPFPVYPWKP